MIVVDSSVWIANLRDIETAAVHKLRNLERGVVDVLLGDLVLFEVLQGARDDRHAQRLRFDLRPFRTVSMLNETLAAAAAKNYRVLRSRGITPRKTVDLMIGTFCIEQGHSLLHDDRDFVPMVEYLGLQVI